MVIKPLKSADQLRRLQKELADRPGPDVVVRVCSTGCRALGALDVCDALEAEVARRDLGKRVSIVRTGCHGLCAGAVAMVIDPKGMFYQGVRPDDVPEIIEKTVLGGKTIRRLCFSAGGRTIGRQRGRSRGC